MTWPQWTKRCLALLLIAGAAVPAINVLVDPFDIFQTGAVSAGPYTNQRYHHTKHLLSHPGRYNTLLLGTSVMGIVPPAAVEGLVPGARAYNAGFFMATASDLALLVHRLESTGALPLNVVIGIDPYLFSARPSDLSYEFKFPADMVGQNEIDWWLDALFASSGTQVGTKLIDIAGPVRSVQFDFATGAYSLPKAEAFRKAYPEAHAAKVFSPAAGAAVEPLPVEINVLIDLVRYLKDQGVNVVCFMQPMSRSALRTQGVPALLRWQDLQHRMSVTVLDLSNSPEMANDPSLWYDSKHYTPAAAGWVIQRALQGFDLKNHPN